MIPTIIKNKCKQEAKERYICTVLRGIATSPSVGLKKVKDVSEILEKIDEIDKKVDKKQELSNEEIIAKVNQAFKNI